MKILLKNRVYDVLKWGCLIALPACSVCYGTLAGVWGWPFAVEVSQTLSAVGTLLGALIGLSTAALRKEQHAKDE